VNKVQRLNKLHKLLKIQEYDVLAEYKELQRINDQIKAQIYDLLNHSAQSTSKLANNSIDVSQLILVRRFNEKIELVVEQLQARLTDNDKNLESVTDKIMQLRASLTSIKRLTGKHQLIKDYENEQNIQKQIEENINYTLSTLD
tara:strand:+ start:114754 stop:115185 length:432 start_codon:yes stop_codon:yes gene_type:complete